MDTTSAFLLWLLKSNVNGERIEAGVRKQFASRAQERRLVMCNHAGHVRNMLIWSGAWYLLCVLASSGLLAQSAPSRHLRSQQEVISLLRSIRSAPEDIGSGRGQATVTEQSNGKKQELQVAFRFLGQSTRSDIAIREDQSSRSATMVNTPMSAISYNGTTARILPSGSIAFCRDVGWDCSPAAFATLRGHPLALTGIIENIQNGKMDVAITENASGTIRIACDYRFGADSKMLSKITMEVDPNADMRLVLWEQEQRNVNGPNSEEYVRYDLKWKRYGDSWYASEATLAGKWVDAAAVPTPASTLKRKVVITAFEPNARVADEEFTLPQLGLRDGTHVIDDITGIDYLYGGPKLSESDLEEVMKASSLARTTKVDQPREYPKRDSQASPASAPQAALSKSSTWFRWEWSCGIAIAVIVGLWTYRRFRGTKGRRRKEDAIRKRATG